ncbi:MAG: amidase [Actinomycetia bacterium]|nr:amidase [Actinomycetes bacterium]
MSGICELSAVAMAAQIKVGDLSALEVVDAHLERIDLVNPKVNAIVTLVADAAREAAKQADEDQAAGAELGVLHGLPIVHKDLMPTKGIRTTSGSPLFADHVPDTDALQAERLGEAGALVLGKSNTPEFGMGSHTFNEVFGTTLNPWDPARTCGGSSGGAAVALACGMVPIADGSDMGGSLRNPAGWSNVVGHRPSPGLVPNWPSTGAYSHLGVLGPMGRSVADVALLLAAMAGPDRRAPLSLPIDPGQFLAPLDADHRGVRVAWSPRLGDLPVHQAVLDAVESARSGFTQVGATVVDADPDLDGADEVFHVLRAVQFESSLGALRDEHPDRFKTTAKWNIDAARDMPATRVGRAEVLRSELFERLVGFFDEFDFLVTATAQVPPFPIETEYPTEIGGVQLETYIEWMRVCTRITVTDRPAVSIPAGFTPDGLPIGLQIIGQHHDDLGVLRFAHAVESALGHTGKEPPVLDGLI